MTGAPLQSLATKMPSFEIIGPITDIEAIAVGNSIRVIGDLRRRYGHGNWRKRKGIATVPLRDAEVHWYEAHGIGRRRIKIKRLFG